jgi:hypothetical protein
MLSPLVARTLTETFCQLHPRWSRDATGRTCIRASQAMQMSSMSLERNALVLAQRAGRRRNALVKDRIANAQMVARLSGRRTDLSTRVGDLRCRVVRSREPADERWKDLHVGGQSEKTRVKRKNAHELTMPSSSPRFILKGHTVCAGTKSRDKDRDESHSGLELDLGHFALHHYRRPERF